MSWCVCLISCWVGCVIFVVCDVALAGNVSQCV